LENTWLDVVIHAIAEKKGYDIISYECSSLNPFIETMVIASTSNTRQSGAIAQNIKDRLKENGFDGEMRVEGDANSRWLLIDLKDIVVNLFIKEERDVYGLDHLYEQAPNRRYDL
jgi:ribosome-associated protein